MPVHLFREELANRMGYFCAFFGLVLIMLWDTIVSNKTHVQRDRLLSVRQQVLDRYSYYQDHFKSLDRVLCYGENIAFCSECNNIKGTAVFDDEMNRKYMHFYLDCIPEYQFLFVRFESGTEETVPQITTFLILYEGILSSPNFMESSLV